MTDTSQIPGEDIAGGEAKQLPPAQTPTNQPDVDQTTSNDWLDQMLTANKNTPKQDYSASPEDSNESSDGGSGNPDDPGNQDSGSDDQQQQQRAQTDDQIRKQAEMHVVFFDFAASRGLAMWAGDDYKKYKIDEKEQASLSDALYDYYKTLDKVPTLPPWAMLAAVVVMTYWPKFNEAKKVRKAKKTTVKNAPRGPQRQPEATDVKYTVVPDTNNSDFGKEATNASS